MIVSYPPTTLEECDRYLSALLGPEHCCNDRPSWIRRRVIVSRTYLTIARLSPQLDQKISALRGRLRTDVTGVGCG